MARRLWYIPIQKKVLCCLQNLNLVFGVVWQVWTFTVCTMYEVQKDENVVRRKKYIECILFYKRRLCWSKPWELVVQKLNIYIYIEYIYKKKLCLKVERGLEFRGFLLLHGVLSYIVNISHSLAWISHWMHRTIYSQGKSSPTLNFPKGTAHRARLSRDSSTRFSVPGFLRVDSIWVPGVIPYIFFNNSVLNMQIYSLMKMDQLCPRHWWCGKRQHWFSSSGVSNTADPASKIHLKSAVSDKSLMPYLYCLRQCRETALRWSKWDNADPNQDWLNLHYLKEHVY